MLNAFVDEIVRSYKKHGRSIPNKMVEYLLGRYDFYKVIGDDRKKRTVIQAFNLRGTLNQHGKMKKAVVLVGSTKLPRRVISIGIMPNRNTTVELCLDEGWQFNFRIHNASTVVEPSLKFDVQIVGMPVTILEFYRDWTK